MSDTPQESQAATAAAPPRRRSLLRLAVAVIALVAVVFAGMTFAQAWSMTHYAPTLARTTRLAELGWWGKGRVLVCGPIIRRQVNVKTPAVLARPFETLHLRSTGGQLEVWRIAGQEDAATVLMFPGYGASKDTMLGAAQEFVTLGLNLWMVDPRGIGGSEGSVTSLGYHEADDVAATYREARRLAPQGRIVLYGTSMGAVAILRAVAEKWVDPQALILECPFDRLTTTIGNRFAWMGLPRFPLAQAVALWAGAQQGFNGLAHNPVEYARRVHCPTLLLQGELDESVGPESVRHVTNALAGPNTFELIPHAGHAFLATRAPTPWRHSVHTFLAGPGVHASR